MTFTPQSPNRAIESDVDKLKSAIAAADTVIWDVRTEAEYTGANSRGNARVGHLPGAAHLEWVHLVAEDDTFKSRGEIEEIARGLGITPEKHRAHLLTGRGACVARHACTHAHRPRAGVHVRRLDGGVGEPATTPRWRYRRAVRRGAYSIANTACHVGPLTSMSPAKNCVGGPAESIAATAKPRLGEGERLRAGLRYGEQVPPNDLQLPGRRCPPSSRRPRWR